MHTTVTDLIALVATGFDTRGRPLVRRNAATGAARVRLHDRGANIQASAPSPGSARDPGPAPRSAPNNPEEILGILRKSTSRPLNAT